MSEFKAINTQEEFDAAIKERIKRAEEKFSKKYEGYKSEDELEKLKEDYDKQISDLTKAIKDAKEKASKYDSDIAERDAKIKGYETSAMKSRIAHEAGLSYESIDFLRGEDEESIKKSAEALKSLIGNKTAPLASADTKASDPNDAAMKKLAKDLFGEN